MFCFLQVQDPCNVGIFVVECLHRKIYAARSAGDSFFKEQQDRKLESFIALRTYSGIAAGVQLVREAMFPM